jgi:hypothetical protein
MDLFALELSVCFGMEIRGNEFWTIEGNRRTYTLYDILYTQLGD